MDYNDNDYEGQNLHLAGEESSKSSSVLRPFSLPKFDFVDSLHGHLRFDSLVENEVFLGIPSQEDNQWIEDFSRGSSGIEFNSSAAESCALLRRNNVWSEATSSESVEMLLKAVGQEEMVLGETMIEEGDLGNQLGSSVREMDNKLRQDDKIDDVDNGSPSLPPAQVQGNFSTSNQSAGVEGVQTEYTLPAQETKFSSYGVYVDGKESSLTVTSESSSIDIKKASDSQVETRGLVNKSLCNQVEENLPVLGKEIDNTQSSSEKIAVSVRDFVDQDKISDSSFVSSSCVAKRILGAVGEQKDKNDEISSGSAVETDNPEMHCSLKIASDLESSKEELAVELRTANFGKAPFMPGKEESLSTDDGCNEVAFVVEPVGVSESGSVVFSSGTQIKQPSEGRGVLCEESSVSIQGEGCIEGLGIKGSDVASPTICSNAELRQVPVTQSSDQRKSLVGDDDICPGSNSSLEASHATSESSMLHEVLGNPSEKDSQSNINHADGPGNLTDLTVASECCVEKSVIDGMRDATYTNTLQKENIKDGDHVPPPLLAGSIQTCREDIPSLQLDVHESDPDLSALEKEDKKLPLDSSDMACEDNEKEGSTFLDEGVKVNVETPTGSQSKSSARDNPGYSDQNIETDSEARKESSTSIIKESLESNELASAIETEKDALLDSAAAGETKTSDQSFSLGETSTVAMPDEACKELREKMQDPASDLVLQDDGAEAAPTEKPMEAEIKSCGTNSPTVSVTSCTVEIDKYNLLSAPGASCTDLAQSAINKQESTRRNNFETIGGVLSTSMNSGVNASSKEEGTFTFDIRPLGAQSAGDFGKGLQSFPRIQACKLSLTGEGSPSPSGSSQTDPMIVKETSHGSSLIPGGCPPSGGLKGVSEHKTRRGSGKSGKGSVKKGNQVKVTTPLRHTEKGDKSSMPLSPLGVGQLMTFESFVKPRGPVPIPTSSLPDLNTSAPSTSFFQQPFTDLQQVQLRAQIFVYGSLIQGTTPDEACMASAFDGGRNVWEPSWRACVEKLHGQKSQGNNSETSIHSRSGAKAPDQTNRQVFLPSEVLSSMSGRASNKAIPSPVVNPMIPLSSPLWSVSTPSSEALPSSSMVRSAVFDYQAVSPLHPYQTPPIRNYVPHTTWPSQAPFPVPWVVPSQSSPFDISTNYSAFPISEPVKLTPVKESSLPITSGTKHVTPIPTTHTVATTMFAGASSLHLKEVKGSTSRASADTKTRKRKKSSGPEDVRQISVTASPTEAVSAPLVSNHLLNKAPAVEDLSQISLTARNQGDSTSIPGVSSHYSTSIAVTTSSSFVPKGTPNQFFSAVPPSMSSDHLKRGDLSIDKRALNMEAFSKVEEAKLQAQEAAAHAAAAISHCEGVWSQLDQQKNSFLTSDAESKLASAAVAIAAAASVAKAAAAAAKIASSAAVQAKQMADEAVTKSGTVNTTFGNNLVNASPVSILKGGDRTDAPTLAISAAKEASRKRVEAASAATRHAEHLDAIVKAAELAAEAVSHAGKIVAMGDPFSLNELVAAGPDNYWKVPQVASVPGSKPTDMSKSKSTNSSAGELPNIFVNHHEGLDTDMRVTSHVSHIQRESSRNMVDDHVTVEESVRHGGQNFPAKDKRVSDSAKTATVVSELDIESRSISYLPNSYESITDIKEGSLVEVLKDRGDFKKAWFSASILGLKDGEALVCYSELQSDEGSEPLKEWVSLEAKDGEAPKVRLPHPMTAVQFEGTRKRRRAAVKDFTWSVGDKVDAWVQDCWREGIVAEKDKKDATTLSVHFPAQGETLMVKLWHLRPTVIWSDGQWIEWCRPGQDGTSQGDTPLEKRLKLGNTGIETKGKGKMAKNLDFVDIGRKEEPRLPLSANEKVFDIGSTRDENKPNVVRTMRSGLAKEGSGVVFGVPKPGKKRKFMDVSKHYVTDRTTKTSVPNDSAKLAKYLMPQGSGSRGTKNNSKLDFKEKQAESRPKALKSGKPPSIPSRTLPRKDDSTSSRPNARDAALSDHIVKSSISNDENESGEQNLSEFRSFSRVEEASEGTMVFSSRALPQENRKKAATISKSERLNQGKLVPAGAKTAKDEANEKLISEVAEPRRSNRRIQPTSRLLEGLQSSLIVSKVPSSSHDKSHRSQNRWHN